MTNYEVEARFDGEWINIGAGEFKDFDTANKALDDIDWPRDELRIKPVGEIDWNGFALCNCGGKYFAVTGETVCDTCGEKP